MKKGFILPLVLLLMSLLTVVSLVLNKISTDRTTALKRQKESYYTEKKITIEMVDEKSESIGETPFSDVVALNSSDGKIILSNQSYVRNSNTGVLWAGEDQLERLDSYSKATCKDIGGINGNDIDCVGTEEFFPCKYSFNLPPERFSEIENVTVKQGEEPSDMKSIPPGNWKMPNLNKNDSPTEIKFTGGGEYHITDYYASRKVNSTFGKGKYVFDNLIYTTGYKPEDGYNLDFGRDSEVWVKGELELQVGTKARFQGGKVFINKLNLSNSNIEVTFGEGIYWIEDLILGNTNGQIKIPKNEKVKIYTDEITVVNVDSSINKEGNPSQLLVVSYDDGVETENRDFKMNGYIYAKDSIELIRGHINGAVISEEVILKEGSSITYYNEEGAKLPTRKSIEEEDEMW